MKNLFTSDTHFGSSRTLELSKRPFKSIDEMDNTIIENINKMVDSNCILNHLGDFGDYEKVKSINCKVRLIVGNYERNDIKKNFNGNFKAFEKHLKQLGFFEVLNYNSYVAPMLHDFKMVNLCHEPSNMRDDMFNIFGHIHKLRMVKKNGLNAGIDCHNYYPIDIEIVEFYRNAILNFYDKEVFI